MQIKNKIRRLQTTLCKRAVSLQKLYRKRITIEFIATDFACRDDWNNTLNHKQYQDKGKAYQYETERNCYCKSNNQCNLKVQNILAMRVDQSILILFSDPHDKWDQKRWNSNKTGQLRNMHPYNVCMFIKCLWSCGFCHRLHYAFGFFVPYLLLLWRLGSFDDGVPWVVTPWVSNFPRTM